MGNLDVADRPVGHRQVDYLVFDEEGKVVPEDGRFGYAEAAPFCHKHAAAS